MNRPSPNTVNLMSATNVSMTSGSPNGSIAITTTGDDRRQEPIGGGHLPSLSSSGIAVAGLSQAPPSSSKCDESLSTKKDAQSSSSSSSSSASPSPSSAPKMSSSEVTQENALESRPTEANVDTTNRRSQQDETTNKIIKQGEPTTDVNHEDTFDQHEETTGQLQLVPPPRPESSSDRYASHQGRDMHHLAFAADLLRDLDMISDDEDSDDEEETSRLPQ